MIVAHFLTEVNEANMYLLVCFDAGEALLIDAPVADIRVHQFLEKNNLHLAGIFITHEHYDHIGGLSDFAQQYPCPIYAGILSPGGALPIVCVRQGDRISLGNLSGEVIALPGHTPASVGLVFPEVVFTGDALFAGSIGGTTSNQDRDTEIRCIRERVFSLPDNYQIFPGHGPASTVLVERTINPFFSSPS